MNGLLHRLAARAAGVAVPLRADARPPYGGDFAWAEPAGAWSSQTALAAMPEAPASRDFEHRRTATPEQVVGPPALVNVDATGQSTEINVGRPATPVSSTADRAAASRETAVHQTLVVTTASTPPDDPAPVERPDASDRTAIQALESTRPDTRRAPVVRDRSASLPVSIEPPPLMPPSRPDQRPATGFRGAPTDGARREARSSARPLVGSEAEATEVHVHIGRIDVTAVRETAPPRRRPSAAPAPMSLDSYLARRKA